LFWLAPVDQHLNLVRGQNFNQMINTHITVNISKSWIDWLILGIDIPKADAIVTWAGDETTRWNCHVGIMLVAGIHFYSPNAGGMIKEWMWFSNLKKTFSKKICHYYVIIYPSDVLDIPHIYAVITVDTDDFVVHFIQGEWNCVRVSDIFHLIGKVPASQKIFL